MKFLGFVVLGLLLSLNAVAVETGFRGKVTFSEDCRAGYANCRPQRLGIGLDCRVAVEVSEHHGALKSSEGRFGDHAIAIHSAPTISGGVITLNGREFPISTGMQSDNFTMGGSFSAYLGDPSGGQAGARVFFGRVKGRPKAYAAILYLDRQAYRCGRLRPY